MTPKKKATTIIVLAVIALIIAIIFVGMRISAETLFHPAENAFTILGKAIGPKCKTDAYQFVINSTTFKVWGWSALLSVMLGALTFFSFERNKHNASGKENGSAKWYTNLSAYNKKYTEPFDLASNSGENNMILTQDVFLSMNARKTRMNNHVLVVGGSGSGKSRFLIKPNILQANCDYVITDPAGELLASTGKFLEEEKGYKIKVFNLVEMAKSDRYNPFNYINDDLGVLIMINCLIKNTNPSGKSGGDPFWEKCETALLQALCFYLIKYAKKEQRNFTSVMKLLRAAEVDENNPNKKSQLDKIFDEVAIKDPDSIALKQYQTFKMGAGKTLKSILISCSVRLTVFNMREIEALTKEDTIDLSSIGSGDKPQALFIITPAADTTFNFLVSMMYCQLFYALDFKGSTEYNGRGLPRNVRFLLDEFCNIGEIPDFTQRLATIRKHNMSCTIIIQGLSQLKKMYEKDWETITSNCDAFLYLGSEELSTAKEVSERLGKATIIVRDNSRSRGKSGSSSLSYKRSGRELMTPNEVMNIPSDTCILFIKGLDPFFGKKYEYTKHKNYKYTGDADTDNMYINTRDNTKSINPIMRPDPMAIQNEVEEEQRKKYEKAHNSNSPDDKILSKPLSSENIKEKAARAASEMELEKNENFKRINTQEEQQDTERYFRNEKLPDDKKFLKDTFSSTRKKPSTDQSGKIFDFTNL